MTHDLELATIIDALKMWRHYLLGRRSVLMNDHSGLRYLFDQPNLNARQAIWLAMISDFDFEIMYIKGKENNVADTLSIRVQVNHNTTMSHMGWIYMIGSYMQDNKMIVTGSLGTSYNSRVQVIRMWNIISQWMVWLDSWT